MLKKSKKIQKIPIITNIKTESVYKNTFKNWNEWFEILNQNSAFISTHKEIVKFLKDKYRLSAWWQQKVTTAYEIFINRRVEGQDQKGLYSTTVTKNFNINSKVLWKSLISKKGQDIWFKSYSKFTFKLKEQFEIQGGIFGELRTKKEYSKLRFSWLDEESIKPTFLEISLVSRGRSKSMLVFSHTNIKTGILKIKTHKYWRERINQFYDYNKTK